METDIDRACTSGDVIVLDCSGSQQIDIEITSVKGECEPESFSWSSTEGVQVVKVKSGKELEWFGRVGMDYTMGGDVVSSNGFGISHIEFCF